MTKSEVNLPSSHDIAVSTEHLGQTADHHVSIWQDIDVDEVSDSLIDDHLEVVLVSQLPNALQVWTSEQWVGREFSEKSKEPLAPF